MRHRWKWTSALIVAAVLGFVLWLRQRPTPPALPGPIVAAPAPFTSPWPAGVSNNTVRTVRKGEHSDEIEVCGVGKVKLDRGDLAAAGEYLEALTKNARLRWLAALRASDDYRARNNNGAATALHVATLSCRSGLNWASANWRDRPSNVRARLLQSYRASTTNGWRQ